MFTIGMIVGIIFSVIFYGIVWSYLKISEGERQPVIDPVSELEEQCKRPRVVGTVGDCPSETVMTDMEA